MDAKQDSPSPSRPIPPARMFAAIAALVFAGGLLQLISQFSDRLLGPVWFEPFARGCYRIAYFIRLPTAIAARVTLPTHGSHEILPRMYETLVCYAAPFFWAAVALVVVALAKRWRRRKKTPVLSRIGARIPRRTFLVGASSCAVGAMGLGAHAILIEPQRIRLARYTIAIGDLPESLDGFRIVQVSDTHYGPFVSMPYLRAVIDQVNALRGDFVILTGDYVHRTPRAIGPGVAVLKRIESRLGAVATLGNHDHWEGADAVRSAFSETTIPLIDNARRFLTRDGLHDEPVPGKSICIGGVGDLWEDRTDFDRALVDTPDDMPRIVLAHNPDTAEIVSPGTRVDLMCSGHTHGGQVWVPGFGTPMLPSHYGQKYAGGLCAGPHCPVLVSRGVGMAVLPVRFCIPPEIVEITLTKLR